MKMKKLALFAITSCLCLAATPAMAATACFDWTCQLGDCDFDASCSSASPFVWKYSWDFGDGNQSGLTGTPTRQYSYPHFPSGPWTVTVQMTVIYWSEPTMTTVSCPVEIGYTVGPQFPLSGRCSFSD